MQPIIDIFNGTDHSKYYSVLRESIAHLSKFKPGVLVRDFKRSKSFLDFLIAKVLENSDRIELSSLINLAFRYEPFQKPNQKIILIDEQGYHKGVIHQGLTGGSEPDEQGNGSHQQTIALSTVGINLDEFYAIACHELGHIYGATRFRQHKIEKIDESTHCIDDMCAMHRPAYNKRTNFRRLHKTPMYCNDCQEGIRKY